MNSIAILIPCYNAASYLPELFEGINAQTVPFDEIICYDDCSTDNTVEIATQLGAKVLNGTVNKGPAFARNRLIEACTCEYIHFHDSDDLIAPHFVEVLRSKIENKGVQFLCNTFVFDRDTRNHCLGNITYNQLRNESDQLLFFLENIGFASMGLYSKFALEDIKGFREDIKGNEDPDLHIRLSEKGYIIKPVDDFLVTKLEHKSSFSHQNWFQCLSDKLKCLESYRILLSEKYHPVIGQQAAMLSNYFYKEGNKSLSKRARALAFNCNAISPDTGKISKKITDLFGLKFYLWLYRLRVDLRLI